MEPSRTAPHQEAAIFDSLLSYIDDSVKGGLSQLSVELHQALLEAASRDGGDSAVVRERCSHGGALCLRKGCINTAIHALNSPNAEVFANYLAHGAIGVAYKDPGELGGEEETPKQTSGPNLRQAYDPLSGLEMGIAGICVLQDVSPTNRVAEVIGQSCDSFSPRPEGLTEFDVRNLKNGPGPRNLTEHYDQLQSPVAELSRVGRNKGCTGLSRRPRTSGGLPGAANRGIRSQARDPSHGPLPPLHISTRR